MKPKELVLFGIARIMHQMIYYYLLKNNSYINGKYYALFFMFKNNKSSNCQQGVKRNNMYCMLTGSMPHLLSSDTCG